MSKGDIAKGYFEQGYNCSQSVALAFADEVGMDGKLIARLTGGFGGGMGRMREVCGTVSGTAFVLSALYGYSDPTDADAKAQLYADVQKVAGEFKDKNGSVVCRDLLGLTQDGFDNPQPEKRTDTYYKKRPCGELVKMSADLLEKFIADNPQK
ncbi:C-GCAxxG-C-C family protein [uncultured Eubacterium sp.]|uniref:C-GCAxxG-C-C family protein n=1 Tax=uncultured Eubacterium sp. TaxID=165185 RepID=UPI00261E2FC5|nr:C-GCAxxG-C-C family protein [uncultured Eubacterium sp.]